MTFFPCHLVESLDTVLASINFRLECEDMGEHFPTFAKIRDSAGTGVRAVTRGRFPERFVLRAVFYVILALCLVTHLIYQFPTLFDWIGNPGFYGPYGGRGGNPDAPLWALPLRMIVSMIGPPPVPAIVGFSCLLVLVFTSPKDPVASEDSQRETVTAMPLFEEPIHAKPAPPARHPLDPGPDDLPPEPRWPKRSPPSR